MIDPRTAIALAGALRALYAGAETEMLARVARRLARGIDQPGWAEAKLAELTALRVELERVVARLGAEGPEQLAAMLAEAHRTGAAAAARALGEEALLVRASPGAVAAIAEATTGRLERLHLPILRTGADVYRATIAEASSLSVTGALTRREAASSALRRFADRGVTGFVDGAGRSWDLSSYAEMATRSSIGQAHVEGQLGELAAHGRDLVIVSDSPDECKLCRPWEGRVLTISGADLRYPSVASARAGGLFHPNCTHALGAFIPGLTRRFRGTADPIGAEERARQRENERQVRHWKRREAVALTPRDQRQATAKVREWQAAQRSFIADTGRRRDYRREAIAGPR